jgi:DNA-binding NarL/FixJ family response regulator
MRPVGLVVLRQRLQELLRRPRAIQPGAHGAHSPDKGDASVTIPDQNKNKGAKAVVCDRRRAEVAQDLADGVTVRESAKNLGVSKDTIVKDRKAIAGRFQTEANEAMQEYRAEVLLKLAEIEALVSDPTVDKIDKARSCSMW